MSEETIRVCAFCGSVDSNLRLCGACKVIRYCNTEHQKQHWKSHKALCQQLGASKESLIKNKRNKPTSKVKTAENGQESALTLDKSLLDSVIRKQVYSDGNSYQEADLSTPIDTEMGVEDKNARQGSRQKLQSLYQLELSPNSLTECLGPNWLSNVTNYVLGGLNKYGFCAVDNFLGKEYADRVLSEVVGLHDRGILSDGQVVSRHVRAQAMGMIRGDKITWVSGAEQGCETIRQLVCTVDSVVANANKHSEAGRLADYNIAFRTRAMVACYPGGGTGYVRHIDNPNRDGRCITAIYYINENWQPEDGGVLRIYPMAYQNKVALIEPIFDRMLFFWSDRRNPHEVLPSTSIRYAITVWYLDKHERDQYLARCSSSNS